MRSMILLLIVVVVAGTLFCPGCVTVNAPEKVDVKADTGNAKWNRTADKYVSQYAGSGKSDSQRNDEE